MQSTLAMLFIAAPLLAVAPRPAADIAWEPSLEKALERAKSERKILFVAVNMDGEGANDRTAKFVYKDKDVTALAASTVNVVASLARHADAGKPCGRFAGIECAVHIACDNAVRQKVLKPDPTGNVVAPEHVFLDFDGKPLLSVPYEVTASELEWCFVTAQKRADPSSKVVLPGNAHMPRRVVIGAVYDPTNGVGGAIQPLTKSELAELIKSVKKGMEPEAKQVAFWRILHSDAPEAIAFIQAELRSGGGAGMDKPSSDPSGGGGAGGGGGGGPGGDGGQAKHGGILHAMGAVSPSAYWELAADFLDSSDEILRAEAAAALEQMATPLALKAIEKALAKEKKPETEKDLVRAWAACGASDAKVRAALVKRARTEKDELVRTSAIVALGLVDPDPDVKACIQEQLASKDDNRRAAASLAAALSRDEAWIPTLEPLAAANNAALADAAGRALETLRGGSLQRLAMPVWAICKDKVTRERTFGKQSG